ncbi:MAG: cell division protein ZipA C-terminal FtsZ-binding domain-containing protein [Succinivibrio sp.]
MTLNDSSSLILIVGAIAILAFVVHGLWFSGRSINRKLIKTSKEDQEIASSSAVGKVRIVKPNDYEGQKENFVDSSSANVEGAGAAKIEPVVVIPTEFQKTQDESPESTYELNLYASNGRAYRGLDLEELFKSYGFIRAEQNLFCVYEPVSDTQQNVVFRICSLEAPYSFPVNMEQYSTSSLALYMQLPEKGKCFVYFKAMRIAAKCLIDHLGGVICDNNNREVTEERLDQIEHLLKKYDKSEE